MDPITQGLYITAIGMGLIFLAILLLWGLIYLLVKITQEKPAENKQAAETFIEVKEDESAKTGELQLLKKVALIAVAIATSSQKPSMVINPQDTGYISPWQSTKRTHILGQSSALLNKKSRGTKR
jgi:Na+-transporting methylmalonyl-CoA/oxaloacetate decarboxylase gamma subunit